MDQEEKALGVVLPLLLALLSHGNKKGLNFPLSGNSSLSVKIKTGCTEFEIFSQSQKKLTICIINSSYYEDVNEYM